MVAEEIKRRYRLVYAEDPDKTKTPQGDVIRMLTDTQADRMRRLGVQRPNSRLQSVDLAEED